jgi:cyanophycinase
MVSAQRGYTRVTRLSRITHSLRGFVIFCLAACASAGRPAPAIGTSGSTNVRGTLFIVGGGYQSPDLVKRFVDLAGGRGKARIAILPMATEDAVATGAEKKAQLDSLGADAFVLNITRAQADDDSIVNKLAAATGIWFPGGDQSPLAAALRGSAALRTIHDRYRAGAVVGGTSAGAAVMSDSMITGNQFWPGMTAAVDSPSFARIARRTVEIVPGLGFLHNAIVDQHFLRRQRENRLFSAVLERPNLLGVGIDEGTALEVSPDGSWTVFGASAVVVFDARRASVTSQGRPALGAADIRVSVLPAGSTFDPRTGRGSLPPS